MLHLQYNILVFNIVFQDGPVAVHVVPHIHVHILPINDGDLDCYDSIYDRLK